MIPHKIQPQYVTSDKIQSEKKCDNFFLKKIFFPINIFFKEKFFSDKNNFVREKNFIGKSVFIGKKILSGKTKKISLKRNSQIRDKKFGKVMKLTKIWPIK